MAITRLPGQLVLSADIWVADTGLADMWRRSSLPMHTKRYHSLSGGKLAFVSHGFSKMSAAGYYTMLVRPGVRVLVLNSQLGYVFNFYSLLPDHPVADQMFTWAASVLDAARLANERVLLIGHISDLTSCLFVALRIVLLFLLHRLFRTFRLVARM